MTETATKLVDTGPHTNSVVDIKTENTGHKFTEQQIEEHCENINKVCSAFGDKWMALESVQIIKQLQAEL